MQAFQLAAALLALWPPGPSRPHPARPFVVLLDPGHGGSDTGACVPALHRCEKDLTLEMAQGLKTRLEATGAFRVVLTRTQDLYVPLYRRSLMANEIHADLFVSLHLNASPNHRERGFEVYAYEDLPSLRLGNEAAAPDVLTELAERGLRTCSVQFADLVRRHFEAVWGPGLDRGTKRAALGVLSALTMPGVLVEFGFLDQPVEGRRLSQPAFRQRLIEALARAIQIWARRAPRLGCTKQAHPDPSPPGHPRTRPPDRNPDHEALLVSRT